MKRGYRPFLLPKVPSVLSVYIWYDCAFPFSDTTVSIKDERTYKDDYLLEKFNIYASQKKKWLPPNYGKTVYEDMSAKEQAVIDDFQGKEAYDIHLQ